MPHAIRTLTMMFREGWLGGLRDIRHAQLPPRPTLDHPEERRDIGRRIQEKKKFM